MCPLAALVGGLVTAAADLRCWPGGAGIQGFRLVLVGIGINAMLVAAVKWLLVVAGIYQAAQAPGLAQRQPERARLGARVRRSAIALVVLVPAALVLAHVLGGLQFGDDTARGLGIRVDGGRTRRCCWWPSCWPRWPTAAAGPIAFVALVVPADRPAPVPARPPADRDVADRSAPR